MTRATDDTAPLANTLKGLLAERDISAAELARRTGVSVASLSRILAGQVNPSFGSIQKIAQALGVSMDTLTPSSPRSGATATQTAPSQMVSAVYVLEDTTHSPESAAELLAGAAVGTWTPCWTNQYVDPSLPQPTVVSTSQTGTRRMQVELAFPHTMLEKGSIASLLSVVGASLTGTGAKLMDIRIPEVLVRTFNGPNFGIRGLRDTMNKHGRPLLSATMRPMHGLSPRLYGRAVHEALLGGTDITADPTMLHHIPTLGWRERFRFAAEATHTAIAHTNEFKTHACNITAATVDDMLERANWAKDLEMAMVLVDSTAIGWVATQSIAAWCAKNEMLLCAMGGRAMVGDMLSDQLQAKLLRMAGADVVSTGSPLRGNVSNRRHVAGVLGGLRDDYLPKQADMGHFTDQPMGGMAASMPAVGGGHNPWHFPRLIDAVGDHTIIQCGGSVMGHPWGSHAGAAANRTAIEAVVQARGEGHNLNVEGRNILLKASRYSPDLKAALDHWQEGSFLFGVVAGNRPTGATIVPPTQTLSTEVTNITTFRRPEPTVSDDDNEPEPA